MPVADTDLAFEGAARLAAMLAAGEITAPRLTDLYLERIARLDPRLNSYRVVLADAARAEAAAAQARLDRGERAPLLGVPVAVKDVIDVAGERTTHGTGAVERVAEHDAEAVARLRAAGAVILGKTTTPELAMWGHLTETKTYGPTRNPWDPGRSTGGSSGGNAAAVAAGLAAGALGTDGGASIRVPSALCGVFGIKPQRGRVPVAGGEHWYGMTHWGPMTRTVADAVLMLGVLGGEEIALAEERPLRVGVAYRPGLPTARLGREQRGAVEATAALLRELGHATEDVRPKWGQLLPIAMPRYLSGVADDAAALDHPERLEPRSRRMAAAGRALHGRALRWARPREAGLVARLAPIFERCDVLLMPVVARGPDPVGRWAKAGAVRTFNGCAPFVAYTAQWNVTGQPAASVPAGFDADGLPLSVQLVGRAGDEATVLRLAASLEVARPWSGRRPPVS